MLDSISIEWLIKYYWIFAPIFIMFSGEITMTIFGILAVRYPIINVNLLLFSCFLSSFLNEQLLFFLPLWNKNKLDQYKNNFFYKYFINLNHTYGLLLFIIGRFLPIIRIILPIALGSANVNVYIFSLVNLLASFLWCKCFVALGLSIGKKTLNIEWSTLLLEVKENFNFYKNILFWVILSLIIIFFIFLCYKYIKSRKAPVKD